jgi:hypothetical protein
MKKTKAYWQSRRITFNNMCEKSKGLKQLFYKIILDRIQHKENMFNEEYSNQVWKYRFIITIIFILLVGYILVGMEVL